ncbi:hypothetical protein HMPREF2557_03020 [Neisseria sp. HMSC064F03]|nr:hypothetical protein HMPREF2557_03020 [Neisseria sp. HMSC064F03]
MELLPYFLFCLVFLYFIAIIINSVMVYKILKSEGMDIGFLEYLFIGSMQFKSFRVLFGIQKISNKFYLKILRINFTVAIIILILCFFCCLIFDVFSIKINLSNESHLFKLRPLQNSSKSPKFSPRHLGDFS